MPAEQNRVRSGDKHHDERSRRDQRGRAEIDLDQESSASNDTTMRQRKMKSVKRMAGSFFRKRENQKARKKTAAIFAISDG